MQGSAISSANWVGTYKAVDWRTSASARLPYLEPNWFGSLTGTGCGY